MATTQYLPLDSVTWTQVGTEPGTCLIELVGRNAALLHVGDVEPDINTPAVHNLNAVQAGAQSFSYAGDTQIWARAYHDDTAIVYTFI